MDFCVRKVEKMKKLSDLKFLKFWWLHFLIKSGLFRSKSRKAVFIFTYTTSFFIIIIVFNDHILFNCILKIEISF